MLYKPPRTPKVELKEIIENTDPKDLDYDQILDWIDMQTSLKGLKQCLHLFVKVIKVKDKETKAILKEITR